MDKCKVTFENIGKVCLSVFVIVSIPILLNFILQWNTPFGEVIGDSNGTEVWLGFWGAYLAAIGSTIMAVVAVISDRKTREQYAKKAEYDTARLTFDLFEKQLIEDTKLYSVARFTQIYRLCFDGDVNAAILAQQELCKELEMSSIYAVRFSKTTPYNEYLQPLQQYNKKFINCAIQIKEHLVSYENGDQSTESREILRNNISYVCRLVEAFCNKTDYPSKIGFEILCSKESDLHKLLNEIHL